MCWYSVKSGRKGIRTIGSVTDWRTGDADGCHSFVSLRDAHREGEILKMKKKKKRGKRVRRIKDEEFREKERFVENHEKERVRGPRNWQVFRPRRRWTPVVSRCGIPRVRCSICCSFFYPLSSIYLSSYSLLYSLFQHCNTTYHVISPLYLLLIISWPFLFNIFCSFILLIKLI